jgi:hypothetical protein
VFYNASDPNMFLKYHFPLINTVTLALEAVVNFNDDDMRFSRTHGTAETLVSKISQILRNQDSSQDFPRLNETAGLARDLGMLGSTPVVLIDKGNSAEICEASNSMFRWYKGSGICFCDQLG